MNNDLELELIPSPDDPDYEDHRYQNELTTFENDLKDAGLDPSARMFMRKAVGFGSLYTGEFYISAAKILGPPIIAAVGGWLAGRNGRKVRVKVGDIEAEANTMQQIEVLLERAQKLKQDNEPKRIHE